MILEATMRTCRHLAAFVIKVEVLDPAKAGLPPWGAVCEDCAATVVEALQAQSNKIVAKHPSGKSSAAGVWARIKRLLEDWKVAP